MKSVFKLISNNLPLYAEEGNVSQVLSKTELETLLNDNDFSSESSLFAIEIIERMFLSLSLLDKKHLNLGEWKFVSYPAYLFARSIVKTWLSPEQYWIPENFWYPEQPDTVINKQRQLLHDLENRRINFSHNQDPIRFIHVAWAFIKLDDQFLLFHREDTHRSDVANYVPIGGRLHLYDLPETSLNPEDALQIIQRPVNSTIKQALVNTLVREIEEETGLYMPNDYQYDDLISLNPYHQIEGAGSKHAYTEYFIQIFSVKLTQQGSFHLQDQVRTGTEFTKFSCDEMTHAVSSRGETAYLEALFTHFNNDKEKIFNWLSSIPNSYSQPYRFTESKYAIDFPYSSTEPLIFGKTGKEKKINLDLTGSEQSWLLSLAWHSKKMGLKKLSDQVTLYENGWIGVDSDYDISSIKSLAQKLTHYQIPSIDWFNETKFRLSIHPDLIFFSEHLFEITFSESDLDLCLNVTCSSITLPIGQTTDQHIVLNPTENVFNTLRSIAVNNDKSLYENESLPKQIRRLEAELKPIGLRKIIRLENGIFKFTVVTAV